MKSTLHPAQERIIRDVPGMVMRPHFHPHYPDPKRRGFGRLVVLDHVTFDPSAEPFAWHPHHDMEIVSLMFEGAIAHEDSMGEQATVGALGVQAFTAGTGITHREYNGRPEVLDMMQVWIQPREAGLAPRYMQRTLESGYPRNEWVPLAAPKGTETAVEIQQDAWIQYYEAEQESDMAYDLNQSANGVYFVLWQGEARIGTEVLRKMDAITVVEAGGPIPVQLAAGSKLIAIEVPL